MPGDRRGSPGQAGRRMTGAVSEQVLHFDCAGERLLGILHQPAAVTTRTGMVLVVGGPQYRVGSHRQFVLLARDLAASGIPVLRFDYRGMGDSTGGFREFEDVAEDIAAAIDTFVANSPGVRQVVLWGLCDAASANAFYAGSDARVAGQVALNPWVRTIEGEAQAFIRHYYLRRLFSPDLWRKVFTLQFSGRAALGDLLHKLRASRNGDGTAQENDRRPLPVRLKDAQLAWRKPVLMILSGQDLTAREYLNRVAESADWQQWLDSQAVDVRHFADADHTFSCAAWRDQVSAWTRDWILLLGA